MKIFLITLLFAVTGMAQGVKLDTQSLAIAYSQGSTAVGTGNASALGAMLLLTDSTPASGTFTCAASDDCSKNAHGYPTGLVVQVSTSAADLPSGLSAATDYYVINVSTNVFRLASSLVNALAGTAIDIADAGTGTHTVTPTALGGASAKLQVSNDGTNWADLPIDATGDVNKSVSITVTANKFLSDKVARSKYMRVYYTLTAGYITGSQITSTKY